ncbi:MAG TPA: SDR family NAD(P)-dependent oxidoreductase [Myxococcales bacterium]|nr:SDR family NAD(P)-dependent oxidoreductase [Myxococcales bacterium]
MAVTWQRAIVVGASSGIGEAIAKRLARDGATVALVARRQEELQRVASEIAQPGGRAEVFVHDVLDADAAGPLFDRIVAKLGGLDVIVYASGVLRDFAEGEWSFQKERETVEVNLVGAMAWLNPAGARFQAQQSGTIIGISSIAGERGRRGNPSYAASKAALTTYLESLRNRLGRYGVRVVTVKPGYIDTPMTKGKPGLFWLISADQAADRTLALARRGPKQGFVPARWGLVALVLRLIPSFVFRRLNF